MSTRRAARLLLACAIALAPSCDRSTPEPAPDVAQEAQDDDRLAHLFGGGGRSEPFTADTTDLLALQVKKLATAEAHVASRIRADVLSAGRAAVPELRRAFEATFSEPGVAPRLLPLLDLAGQAGGEDARAMALAGLEHPSESVRAAACRVLQTTGRPEDWERLSFALEHGGEELASAAALALAGSDPGRVARELPDWIGDPRRARVVDAVVPRVAAQCDATTRARIQADARASALAKTWMLAVGAAGGEEAARSELLALLTHENPVQRQVATTAAGAAGLSDAVVPIVSRDPDPVLRALALEALAREPDTPARRALLAGALSDEVLTVRRVGLNALCAVGDPRGIDAAVEMLGNPADEVLAAMSALRAPLARDPELAERVLARLAELLQGGARSGGRAIERAIGQVPLARAAEILLERGRLEEAPIQGIPPHRWYAVQAGNAGPAGRAWLRAEWDAEADPVRRRDLLSAGSQESSPEVEAFLARVLESPRATDAERLLAADLLARSTPAARAAPVLKRAAPFVVHPAMRRAFDALLWRFYGP